MVPGLTCNDTVMECKHSLTSVSGFPLGERVEPLETGTGSIRGGFYRSTPKTLKSVSDRCTTLKVPVCVNCMYKKVQLYGKTNSLIIKCYMLSQMLHFLLYMQNKWPINLLCKVVAMNETFFQHFLCDSSLLIYNNNDNNIQNYLKELLNNNWKPYKIFFIIPLQKFDINIKIFNRCTKQTIFFLKNNV